jgi:predicted RecB family nuclease
MRLIDDRLTVSASDLNNFIECPHLTHIDLAVARGELTIERTGHAAGDLAARRGEEHERAYLDSLKANGSQVVEIPIDDDHGNGFDEAVKRTDEAMRAGAQVIYQAAFMGDGWVGRADFLERVDRPSRLGSWSYEVADTKLARRARPRHLLQLCTYSELLAESQGTEPRLMHIVLGTGERKSYAVADFSAYYRHLRERYLGLLAEGVPGTYPYPCDHCAICRWSDHCDERRLADDHLSLVARISRQQTVRLNDSGITTVAKLARAEPDTRPPQMAESTFDTLRNQARLQVMQRDTGGHHREFLLPPAERRGLCRLPPPSEGDVFFDMEGDPFFEGGLEYLFGIIHREGGEERFTPIWAHDHAEEKAAFERFVDFVMERLERYPDMHVYHYAHYEPSTLKRLMGEHGTREDEIDHLLRNHVFVDLYRVVAQGIRISQPSYSLKKVEAFYMEQRDTAITDAEDSIIQYERFLETRDLEILDAIERYNEDDCRSTARLHEWLIELRSEVEQKTGEPLPWFSPPEAKEPDEEKAEAQRAREALKQRLIARAPEDLTTATDEEQALWLAGQLLDYHRREAKPSWWEYFARLERSQDELIAQDSEAIGGLRAVPGEAPVPDERSLINTLEFPPQEHKLSPDDGAIDPATERSVNLIMVDEDAGRLQIRRGKNFAGRPLPVALIPDTPYSTHEQRAALGLLAREIDAHGIAGEDRYRALKGVLLRELPRVRGREHGSPLQEGAVHMDELAEIVAGLDSSHLFIQGPPGSGKTWTGAQLVVSRLAEGKRVGVASTSHKAIHNLLHEIETAAVARGVAFKGLKKARRDKPESFYESNLGDNALIENSADVHDFPPPPEVQLVAGTAWLFPREEMDGMLDYLFIDEAGQVSLADALAVGTAADNLVLLGDPLQLAQVSQAIHPDGAGASVLEHLLGLDATIPPERGIFLDKTRRMHPNVCRYISDTVYEGRLESIEECASQDLDTPGITGTGLRSILIRHEGNSRRSVEEADRIAAEIGRMRGGTVTEANGTTRDLREDDFMVVTPYNAQVRCLRERLPDGVRIGTVDKFQGQEAMVVFFSMASSSGAEIPRNIHFLFSRNRLNVAISRARCLAVLVASPDLLYTQCPTVEQMRLVNALCRLVEVAERQIVVASVSTSNFTEGL